MLCAKCCEDERMETKGLLLAKAQSRWGVMLSAPASTSDVLPKVVHFRVRVLNASSLAPQSSYRSLTVVAYSTVVSHFENELKWSSRGWLSILLAPANCRHKGPLRDAFLTIGDTDI